jgi:hypothetical protein
MFTPCPTLNYQNLTDTRRERTGWLRALLAPSVNDSWNRLAATLPGSFAEGGWFTSPLVAACHGPWTLTLDITHKGEIPYTRLRAPYASADVFRFTIYRAGPFTRLAERMGMQDVRIGLGPFDDAFVIQSNSPEKVRALLLSSFHLRYLLVSLPHVHFTVQDAAGCFKNTQFPSGADELCFEYRGVVKEVDRLLTLFELVALTLDTLHDIGSARAISPERPVV